MRDFYHLLANSLLVSITNFTVWFAIIFFSYLQTQSVFVTGMISGLYLVSVAASGFWFGSLVDHYRKKKLLLIAGGMSLVFYSIGFLLYLFATPAALNQVNSPLLWILIVTLMAGVIVGGIRNITLPVMVSLVVADNKRDKANGLVGTTTGVSFLVTSVVSGLLVGASGMYWVLLLAMVVMGVTLIDLYFIPVPERRVLHTQEKQSKKVDLRGTYKVIQSIPGFLPLILFTTVNNFLGGVFMALMDAYGLSLVSVQVWGLLWGVLSVGFILGGGLIARFGLGREPLRTLFAANLLIWLICSVFTLQASIVLLAIGMFIYLTVVPVIEAAEQTIIQKVVPVERQGRVFGFAHSVEQSASPLTAFLIGPLTQWVFIPFMTTGRGVELIGAWFGTGPSRGIALVFTLTGIIGFGLTFFASRSAAARLLAKSYQTRQVQGLRTIAEPESPSSER